MVTRTMSNGDHYDMAMVTTTYRRLETRLPAGGGGGDNQVVLESNSRRVITYLLPFKHFPTMAWDLAIVTSW